MYSSNRLNMRMNKNIDEMEGKERSLRDQDTAMKRLAMRQTTKTFYPTNLPYLTMQRVYEEQARAAKRTHWMEGIAVGVMLCLSTVVVFIFCGDALRRMFDDFFKSMTSYSLDTSSVALIKYALFAFCFVFFVSINALLNRYFGKKE